MTKEEEEAFAFYENEMYGDSEISEEEDLDDFTFPEDEADDIEKETETEGHFNWHCEKVGELFGATYFKVCPGWTGKGFAPPLGLPSMVKKERGKLTTLNHIRDVLAKKNMVLILHVYQQVLMLCVCLYELQYNVKKILHLIGEF